MVIMIYYDWLVPNMDKKKSTISNKITSFNLHSIDYIPEILWNIYKLINNVDNKTSWEINFQEWYVILKDLFTMNRECVLQYRLHVHVSEFFYWFRLLSFIRPENLSNKNLYIVQPNAPKLRTNFLGDTL